MAIEFSKEEQILLELTNGKKIEGSYNKSTILGIITSLTSDTPLEKLPLSTPKIEEIKPSVVNTSSYQGKYKIKKGDVFVGYSVNGKRRPIVVVRVDELFCSCIPLTTTEDEYTLIPYNSRFFRGGFLSNQILRVKHNVIKHNFVDVLDDNRTLNKAIKLLKNYYPNFI